MTHQTSAAQPARRPPTAAEARALGHPTRLRILFACRERARTNKQLAQQLGTTPGTIHYHLRPLLEEGFLRREDPRPGPRGSIEQPYRSTGKSWEISGSAGQGDALRQVAADEVRDARDADSVTLSRLGATLERSVLTEVVGRLEALLEEIKARNLDEPPPGADVESVTVVLSVTRDRRAAAGGS